MYTPPSNSCTTSVKLVGGTWCWVTHSEADTVFSKGERFPVQAPLALGNLLPFTKGQVSFRVCFCKTRYSPNQLGSSFTVQVILGINMVMLIWHKVLLDWWESHSSRAPSEAEMGVFAKREQVPRPSAMALGNLLSFCEKFHLSPRRSYTRVGFSPIQLYFVSY